MGKSFSTEPEEGGQKLEEGSLSPLGRKVSIYGVASVIKKNAGKRKTKAHRFLLALDQRKREEKKRRGRRLHFLAQKKKRNAGGEGKRGRELSVRKFLRTDRTKRNSSLAHSFEGKEKRW